MLVSKLISVTLIQLVIVTLFSVLIINPTPTSAQDNNSALIDQISENENSFTHPTANAGAATAAKDATLTGWGLTVYNFLTVIGAFFAWIGGFLLDVSISVFVANMAGAAQYMGLTSIIEQLWEVIRDFINLLFIFSLIWIGFQTILDTGGADAKKWIAHLVIAALLINFSLYIAQVVVDFSNVAAFQISKMMVAETYSVPILGIEVSDISGGFTAKTNLQNFPKDSQVSLNKFLGDEAGVSGIFTGLAMGFVVMLMLIILGFVFAAGAVILFTRFIALSFLMVFSPLLFIAWIFPNFGQYGKQWWGLFINQALVGPAFIFMLYFSYRVLEGFANIGASGGEYTLTNILVYFVIVIGFVCLSLVVAKKIGAFGASQAISIGKNIGNSARSMATNGALYAPRALARVGVGAASSKIQDKFNTWQAAAPKGGVGSAARAAVAWTNLDRSIIGATDAGKKAKFGLNASYKDNKDYENSRRIRLTGAQAAASREKKINAALTSIENNPNNNPLDQTAMKDLATSIKDLTDSQLTEDLKLEMLTKESVAIHLSGKQVETLEKSGKYSDQQISNIKKARSDGFKNVASGGLDANGVQLANSALYQARNPEWLSQKGVDEIAKMPIEVFQAETMAPYLTPAMIEAKMKSGLSDSELQSIRNNIDAAIIDDLNNHPAPGPGQPSGTGYTKQWVNWVNRTTFGAKLGLVSI